MMTIAKLSDRIGEHISKEAGLESEVAKICYGIECLLVFSLNLTAILTAGWLANAFKETLIIAMGTLLMKYIIGGPHLSGFSRCVGYSILFIVGLALLLKYYYLSFSPYLLLFLLTAGFIIIWFFAPMVTTDKVFSQPQVIRRKILGIVVLFILVLTNLLVAEFYFQGLLIGVLLSIFNISPVGSNLVKWVDRITKRKEVC